MSEGGEDERPFEIAVSAPSPLEQFQSREDCAEVGEVLLKLEPTYREVLVLRFYERERYRNQGTPIDGQVEALSRTGCVEAPNGAASCDVSACGGWCMSDA